MSQDTTPQPGEPVPWFIARCTSNSRYHFHSVAGRYVVLCFLGSAALEYSQRVDRAFHAHAADFDDARACYFGVSVDPADERQPRLSQRLPGYRYVWDQDTAVSRAFGRVADPARYAPCTLLLDPTLRVLAAVPFDRSVPPEAHAAAVIELLRRQPPIAPAAPALPNAPVLLVPRVFEPDLCRELIAYYGRGATEPSGFMVDRGGKTVPARDDAFKRRRDCIVEDESLRAACRSRLARRLKPEVEKAFQFSATRAERYIVACYSAAEGGFFRPHRDNTTRGTAHRRFAVTLNLNTGEYEGGALRFPEFGQQTYEAPLGGAIVFSCSLLHEATPVTKGTRYAFLPFLYDEAAAQLRQRNMPFLALDPGSGGNADAGGALPCDQETGKSSAPVDVTSGRRPGA